MEEALAIFNEYEWILNTESWKYANNNASMADELQSVARHHFWKMAEKIVESPASTRKSFIYKITKNIMLDFLRKHETPIDTSIIETPTHITPDTPIKIREAVEQLSEEGRFITGIFLKGEAHTIGIDFHAFEKEPPPRKIRGQLIKYLISEGWPESIIYKTLTEVKGMVNAL